MCSIEEEAEKFNIYCKNSGLTEILTNMLVKAYKDKTPADKSMSFARTFLCELCPSEQECEDLRQNFDKAKNKVSKLEEKLKRYEGNIKYTSVEIEEMLQDGWEKLYSDKDCNDSLLKKYLTIEIFEELKNLQTSNGISLFDCIKSGIKYPSSKIGIYAADLECYDIFKKLFDAIIMDYHGLIGSTRVCLHNATDWGNVGHFKVFDPDGKYILLTKITGVRNLEGYPFFQILTENQYLEVEEKVKTIVEQFEGELKGVYMSVKDLNVDENQELLNRSRGDIFTEQEKLVAFVGNNRYYPTGRGVYKNESEELLIWVNKEDHLKVISMSEGDDLGDAYCRYIKCIETLTENLKFASHPRYGKISACPSNLGTTIKAGVHIRLPNLSRDPEKLQKLLELLHLDMTGTYGEYLDIKNGIMNITNKHQLGLTEYEAVKIFQEGVMKLIKIEKKATRILL